MKITALKTQKLLCPTQINLAEFVINPYRGCEFGCKYCYCRQNKNIRARKDNWGRFLDVKTDAAKILEKELTYIGPKKIMFGSTTECFQAKEKKLKITESILKIIKEKNIPIVILTKSDLIKEYIELINFHPENKVYFTFMFQDNKIKNLFEAKSPDF